MNMEAKKMKCAVHGLLVLKEEWIRELESQMETKKEIHRNGDCKVPSSTYYKFSRDLTVNPFGILVQKEPT